MVFVCSFFPEAPSILGCITKIDSETSLYFPMGLGNILSTIYCHGNALLFLLVFSNLFISAKDASNLFI